MRALVTGASSGIGRAIALQLAERGYSVVLVARDSDALGVVHAALPGKHHETLVADLGDVSARGLVCARLRDSIHPVDLFVHSAGVGLPPGGFLGNPVSASHMVHGITVDALTDLAHAALPGMLERGRGGLLTVGSIAGFFPGSAAITYAASKAWAQAFAEGLNELTRGTGVSSTVVAPGFVKSGFHSRAGIGASGIHAALWCTPEQVAAAAIKGFLRGRALVVPGALWKTIYTFSRVAPRNWSRAAFARYMAWVGRRAR